MEVECPRCRGSGGWLRRAVYYDKPSPEVVKIMLREGWHHIGFMPPPHIRRKVEFEECAICNGTGKVGLDKYFRYKANEEIWNNALRKKKS